MDVTFSYIREVRLFSIQWMIYRFIPWIDGMALPILYIKNINREVIR